MHSPEFAPDDPSDGRPLRKWKSNYPEPEAIQNIRFEAVYLAVLLFLFPFMMLLLWCNCLQHFFSIPERTYGPIVKYGLAWFSGSLAGTLFSIKWLYHSVAKQIWHVDRRLWRLFTPHISGCLAFIVVNLMSSGLFGVFDHSATNAPSVVVSVSFLVGYFSDSAAAKMAEIAFTLFGATTDTKKHIANHEKLVDQSKSTDGQ